VKFSNFRAFEKHVEDAAPNHFSNIYLILSKESFERKMAVDTLTKRLLVSENAHLSFQSFEGEKLDVDALLQELNAMNFFAATQVFLINQADKLVKSSLQALEGYFASPNPAIYLILSAASINHATNFYKKAEKVGVVLEFPEEKPWEKEKTLREWIATKVAQEGKQIVPAAANALLKQIGFDQALLVQEIEKLYCYIGERKEITLEDVGEISCLVNTENIWQLGEAIFRGQVADALRIMKNLLDDGSAFLGLLRQIRSQFQTSYQICSILAAGGSGLEVTQHYPYMKGQILERNMQLAQSYGMSRFKAGMLTIDEMELKAKNSPSGDALLAELLIIKLT
jgi:DNA polymerase III subunit delta